VPKVTRVTKVLRVGLIKIDFILFNFRHFEF
jgi:hypothetical protein